MAKQPKPAPELRVKVYELKNNDWCDRGTGHCSVDRREDKGYIRVMSEEGPARTLLDTCICGDGGYQKQQDTLIVWTEDNGADFALSFQESEGCTHVWDKVGEIQTLLIASSDANNFAPEDAIKDESRLPENPTLCDLPAIEQIVRTATKTPTSRDQLAKSVVHRGYFRKLIPLFNTAEDLESLEDLHRLCNIVKTLILLNDNSIIENVVDADIITGVVGALEYDPDFPSHKANHRQFLDDESRFKEVVKIDDPVIKAKIHCTYRLQYLKDVVLARILDDPAFNAFNSLIYYHQVAIIQHFHQDKDFLDQLFAIFEPHETSSQRKKDAVLLIQQFCSVAKTVKPQVRADLYSNLLARSLPDVVVIFALRHADPAVRVAGTDILVSLLEHDSYLVRTCILKAARDKLEPLTDEPLTDILIELLLVECDLGITSQMADAIKVLLDPTANQVALDALDRAGNEFSRNLSISHSKNERFVQIFHAHSVEKLFRPLKGLEHRESVQHLGFQEVSLYSHLIDVLCHFVRQDHLYKTTHYIVSEGLLSRVVQLISCPVKHLKVAALKLFRLCIGVSMQQYLPEIMAERLFDPILDVIYETMPRDNLLNSTCLEMFEYIRRERLTRVIMHLVETYRERLEGINYVPVFQNIILCYEQLTEQPVPTVPNSFSGSFQSPPDRVPTSHGRRQTLLGMDDEQEAYFNASDGDDDATPPPRARRRLSNGVALALVDYPDDDDDDAMDVTLGSLDDATPSIEQPPPTYSATAAITTTPPTPPTSTPPQTCPPSGRAPVASTPPPTRLFDRRRREREEEEDDELDKLSAASNKRRNSGTSSVRNSHSAAAHARKAAKERRGSSHGSSRISTIKIAPGVRSGGTSSRK